MEKLFVVKNYNHITEINELLSRGATVKMIQTVPEVVSSYGYAGGQDELIPNDDGRNGRYIGHVFAYIVLELNPYDYRG